LNFSSPNNNSTNIEQHPTIPKGSKDTKSKKKRKEKKRKGEKIEDEYNSQCG
jgi:hypothetical protein